MFHSLSPVILTFIAPFAILFSKTNWKVAQTLLLGSIMCRSKRTVCGILRSLGLQNEKGFSKYHRVLNQVGWSSLHAAQILLNMLLKLISSGSRPKIFIDETLERRKGKQIKAKGYYRDAVRSSKSITVKTCGLKWLVMAISIRFPFAKRAFALPFLTVLQPSKKCDKENKKRHKTTLQWTCQMVKQLIRWLPNIPFILVGDGGFASGSLAWLCLKNNIALVSRLKMNARLFAFPEEIKGKKGRKSKKGSRLCSFKAMLEMGNLIWNEVEIIGYGGEKKKVRYITNTALWGVEGCDPVPIRWVLIVDPEGKLAPLPLMSTDVSLSAIEILEMYIERWGIEVTFEETREHLGVETQRQWSNLAIQRTTPVLMATYSLVTLIANQMHGTQEMEKENTAWYQKKCSTFSDMLKAVRKQLWIDSSICRKMVLSTSDEKESTNFQLLMYTFIECLSKAA